MACPRRSVAASLESPSLSSTRPYSAAPPRPADFADSTAISARLSSSAASGASTPPCASTAPIDSVGKMSKPATLSGCSIARRISSDGSAMSPGASTANSSSPTRARSACGGKAVARRDPSAASTRSARSWPSASFSRRNRSRSATTSRLMAAAQPAAVRVRGGRSFADRGARSERPDPTRRSWSPAARCRRRARPSSSQTPRQMQVSPPRIRTRALISPPARLDLQDVFDQGPVLRHRQRAHCGR